jgi:DNA modification methylase
MTALHKDYAELLQAKITRHIESGFEADQISENLFSFQAFIVKRALKAGRFAIFADCGLGKTLMQLEWAKHVSRHTNGPVLILAPLTVVGQTIEQGRKFGYNVIELLPEMYAMDQLPAGIYIVNYEQLDNIINADQFTGIVLDESSILKSYTGYYKNLIISTFKETPYKLACTATPAPNDLNEIGNHSEFLNVLDAQDMRSKWFIRDEGMNNYRLKGHGKKDFYAWVSSWSVMITNPADLGFDGSAYVLPPLNFYEEVIKTENRGNGKLYNDVSVNATNFNEELRLSMQDRFNRVAEIANASAEQFIVWVQHDLEEAYCKSLIPGSVVVTGKDSVEKKKKNLQAFIDGKFRVLITKQKICGFGMNFQNCYNQIFASLNFSFEGLYQAIRRSYRFGQKHAVNIWLIVTDTMQNVRANIRQKQLEFAEMQREMNRSINAKEYGLLTTYEFREFRSDGLWLLKGDSCIEIERIPDNSVDLIIYSPPFSSLFTYSNYIHDMGNNVSHEAFFKQYAYLLKHLYRILKPGRLICCHTKDLGIYKNSSGYTGMYDFTGDHTRAVQAEGFKLHSKLTIWCDPVLEMQRTKTQRLLYKTVTTDSTYTGIGMAEYITIFRKWDGNEDDWSPVTNLNRMNFPLDTWQRWASPVWMDIKRTDVLNNHEGTAQGDEKHIAPLQLDVIRRITHLWSNEGETIFTPFLGIGSEAYVAIQEGRKAIGIELKDSYFDVAVKNCRNAQLQKTQLSFI